MKSLGILLPYIKNYQKEFFLGFMFVTLSNVCSTIIPRIVGSSVDTIRTGVYDSWDITINVLLIMGLTALSGVFMFITRRMIIFSSRRIEYDLRNDYIEILENQNMEFFQSNPTGKLMAYATNDIKAAREFLGPAIMYAANSITTFTLAMYFMLSLSWEITLISLIPAPLIAITVYFVGKRVHIAFKDVQDQFSDLTNHVQESISSIRVVKAYLRENHELENIKNNSMQYFLRNIKLIRSQAVTMPILMVLVGASNLIVLGFGGYSVINGYSTIGDLTQFFIYLNLLIWPIAAIGWITNLVQRASASAERLEKVFTNKYEKAEDQKIVKAISGDIEFKDVSFQYNQDSQRVLERISFKIQPGSKIGIAGQIGSGKSTIANLLLKLYTDYEGEIFMDNTELSQYDTKSLRGLIGFVPQEPFLFSTTIEDNIAFGVPDISEELIIEYAKKVEFHDEILAFPDGYKSILGERGITLSGGQKQRLAIVRALLKKPQILILDDPFSSVDLETQEKILNNLKDSFSKMTVILISHRLSSIIDSDQIFYISQGKLVESGSHKELMKNNGLYASAYSRQIIESELDRI